MPMLSHQIRLQPTCKQEVYFRKACGISRFTYNWALAKWKEAYTLEQKPTGYSLKKVFNGIKMQEYPWVYEVSKYVCQQPFIHLQKAFNAFFKGNAK